MGQQAYSAPSGGAMQPPPHASIGQSPRVAPPAPSHNGGSRTESIPTDAAAFTSATVSRQIHPVRLEDRVQSPGNTDEMLQRAAALERSDNGRLIVSLTRIEPTSRDDKDSCVYYEATLVTNPDSSATVTRYINGSYAPRQGSGYSEISAWTDMWSRFHQDRSIAYRIHIGQGSAPLQAGIDVVTLVPEKLDIGYKATSFPAHMPPHAPPPHAHPPHRPPGGRAPAFPYAQRTPQPMQLIVPPTMLPLFFLVGTSRRSYKLEPGALLGEMPTFDRRTEYETYWRPDVAYANRTLPVYVIGGRAPDLEEGETEGATMISVRSRRRVPGVLVATQQTELMKNALDALIRDLPLDMKHSVKRIYDVNIQMPVERDVLLCRITARCTRIPFPAPPPKTESPSTSTPVPSRIAPSPEVKASVAPPALASPEAAAPVARPPPPPALASPEAAAPVARPPPPPTLASPEAAAPVARPPPPPELPEAAAPVTPPPPTLA